MVPLSEISSQIKRVTIRELFVEASGPGVLVHTKVYQPANPVPRSETRECRDHPSNVVFEWSDVAATLREMVNTGKQTSRNVTDAQERECDGSRHSSVIDPGDGRSAIPRDVVQRCYGHWRFEVTVDYF